MKCEKCQKDHDGSYGSGRFCSKECARSYSSNKNIGTKTVKCVTCGKEHEVDKRANSKRCKCDTCRKNKKTKKLKICVHCGNSLVNMKAKKFCSKKCKLDFYYNKYIERWKRGLETGLKGVDQLSNHLRRYIFEKYNHKCANCGWKKINQYTKKIPLQVDHIDGNHKNNKEENLILLCPNCHSLTPTYGGANRGNGREYRYKLR